MIVDKVKPSLNNFINLFNLRVFKNEVGFLLNMKLEPLPKMLN